MEIKQIINLTHSDWTIEEYKTKICCPYCGHRDIVYSRDLTDELVFCPYCEQAYIIRTED